MRMCILPTTLLLLCLTTPVACLIAQVEVGRQTKSLEPPLNWGDVRFVNQHGGKPAPHGILLLLGENERLGRHTKHLLTVESISHLLPLTPWQAAGVYREDDDICE